MISSLSRSKHFQMISAYGYPGPVLCMVYTKLVTNKTNFIYILRFYKTVCHLSNSILCTMDWAPIS